ncbi:MAG TPA: NUDIX hydrolase [Candidatus Bathyarchaeia archaeon]
MIIRRGRILLTVRGKPPSEGMWGLPGGAVEVGETIEEALVREVREETGLDVRPLKMVAVLDSVTRDDDGRVKYHYVLFEYICEYLSGEAHAASDALNARWVPLDDLGSVQVMPTTKRFIQKIMAQEKIGLPNG